MNVVKLLYNAEDAAEACSISERYFLALVSSGKAPQGLLLGRRRLWPVTSLEVWVSSGCRPRDEVNNGA